METTETITEQNRLIAEFLGLDVLYDDKVRHESVPVNRVTTMMYHASWDWLMPVVEKISNLCGFNDIESDLAETRISAKIEDVYSSVVSFIKWYNLQSK